MADELAGAIVEMERDRAIALVAGRLEQGEEPLRILEACRRGMTLVGDRFESGDYYLSELLLSAEIFKSAVALLEPRLAASRAAEPRGKVILATMRGDIHDLGKNILATLLRAHAFEVHDLGVDVEPALLHERAEEIEPDFVSFSALITTAFPGMKEAAELLEKAGIRERIKLLVGGGVTTPVVGEYVGADFQTRDALEAVRYCERITGGG